MNVSSISSPSASAKIVAMHASRADFANSSGVNTSKSADSSRDPSAIKKAASQFEAIILRQLLAPSIEPMMSGSFGGAKDSGGSMYGYMLTDTLATSLAQGGGLGLARMLEKQLTPHSAAVDTKDSGVADVHSQL